MSVTSSSLSRRTTISYFSRTLDSKAQPAGPRSCKATMPCRAVQTARDKLNNLRRQVLVTQHKSRKNNATEFFFWVSQHANHSLFSAVHFVPGPFTASFPSTCGGSVYSCQVVYSPGQGLVLINRAPPLGKQRIRSQIRS